MKFNEFNINRSVEIKESFTATKHLQWAASFPFLFSINQSSLSADFLSQLSKKAYLGKKEGLPVLLGMESFELNDLEVIRKVSSSFLVRKNQENLLHDNIPIHHLIAYAQKLGFRVFQDSEIKIFNSSLSQSIEFIEFVLSNDSRLWCFPANSESSRTLQKLASVDAIFILDLIQDFEVLSPFIKQFSSLGQSKSCFVIVTSRVKESFLWKNISIFLAILGVRIIFVSTVFDAAQHLPQNSAVLFTASESSAPGHNFCYELYRLAPPSLLKVTFQHGHENVGLRHHISHNAAYPKGIRFASDIIFTWVAQEKLVDAFPSELSRCIPVGVTKKTAHEAFDVRNQRYNNLAINTNCDTEELNRPISTLLCENLHSVRFNDPRLRAAFLSMIDYLHNSKRVQLKIRSHPGKRLLEQDKSFKNFSFLSGELNSETLSSFDMLISPPSTIVLDAVLCGVHALTWSASQFLGDLRYYDALDSINKSEDVITFLTMSTQNRADFAIENLSWAANNTAAFDGTQFVLPYIGELL